jgi:hypothetical protein
MFQGLASFCERVSIAIDEDSPGAYLRIRVGDSRRTAQLVASRIEVTGRDPVALSQEIEGRVDALGDDCVWVEAITHGTTNPTDTLRIPRRDDGPAKAGTEQHLACVIERMARNADDRASASEFRMNQVQDRMFGLITAVWEERMKVAELTLLGSAPSGLQSALEVAKPVLAVAASRLLGQIPQTAPTAPQGPVGAVEPVSVSECGDGAEIAASALVDDAIAVLVQAVEDDPTVITPDRVEAMAPLVTTALGL